MISSFAYRVSHLDRAKWEKEGVRLQGLLVLGHRKTRKVDGTRTAPCKDGHSAPPRAQQLEKINKALSHFSLTASDGAKDELAAPAAGRAAGAAPAPSPADTAGPGPPRALRAPQPGRQPGAAARRASPPPGAYLRERRRRRQLAQRQRLQGEGQLGGPAWRQPLARGQPPARGPPARPPGAALTTCRCAAGRARGCARPRSAAAS